MIIQTLDPIPERPWVTLTTYIHEPDPMLPFPAPPRPAILVCPGGGYFMLSPTEGDPIALEFAGAGYNTFVLRYSVVNTAPDGATRYPVQLEKLAAATAGEERKLCALADERCLYLGSAIRHEAQPRASKEMALHMHFDIISTRTQRQQTRRPYPRRTGHST